MALLAMFAASRIVAIAQADRLAREDPVQALQWVPGHPEALATLAGRELATGRAQEAGASARRLLSAAPLDGRGFRLLAQSELRAGHLDRAVMLFGIAQRRSPRDVPTRAWLLQLALARNDVDGALREAEFLLRTAPGTREALVPLLARLSAEPGFARVLFVSLHDDPRWRGTLQTAVHDASAGAGTRVLACWLAVASDAPAGPACGVDKRFVAGVGVAGLAPGTADAIVASVAHRPAVPAGR